MNTFKLAFALGTGLALSLAVPSVQADPIITTLSTPTISASQFSSDFTPMNSAPLTSNFELYNASKPLTGVIQSQVFQGQGAFAGLEAYAYQVSVSPSATDTSGAPVHLDGTSFVFNATPTAANLTGAGGTSSAAYLVTGGTVGSMTPLNGTTAINPDSISFQADPTGSKTNPYTGTLRANFVNTGTSTPPLYSGNDSATFVVLTTSPQPIAQNPVNITSNTPQTGALAPVYSANGTIISPVPAPEPSTLLAWAGMAGAVALVRRVRKSRPAVA
jgi:hypothetical protein